jgi:hypothetical protein
VISWAFVEHKYTGADDSIGFSTENTITNNDFITTDYCKDGEFIEEAPFVADDNQEYLTRDYRKIIMTRFPSLNKDKIPQRWKNLSWSVLYNDIRNGENKYWTNKALSYMRNRASFREMMVLLRENDIALNNVVDATANIGGDAIAFAMETDVGDVTAYEIQSETCAMLLQNITLYGVDVKVICDAFDYDIPKGSLVVIDPPFEKGNTSKTFNLSIDDMPICAVADKLLKLGAGAVLLSMPRDYAYNLKYAQDHNQSVIVRSTQKNVKFFLITAKQ